MYQDLFAQAEALAKLDAKKPKQASLRRAISTAYYAVFHYLVHEACCVQFGTQHAQAAYRHVLARAFSHAVMKQACVSYAGGSLRDAAIKGLPRDAHGNYPILKPIQDMASAFVELQQKRHFADYDLCERYRRSEVLTTIEEAQNRLAAFSALEMSDEKRFFLACLWAWKELVNR